jgi:DNA-binding SARP family transcriptional activator
MLPEATWRHTHPRQLLQALSLAPGQQLPRDSLADLLWPQASTAAALNRLYHAVHALRKILLGHGVHEDVPLVSIRAGIVTLSECLRCDTDAHAFLHAVAAARSATDADSARRWAEAADALIPAAGKHAWKHDKVLGSLRDELLRAALWVLEYIAVAFAANPEAAHAAWQRLHEFDPTHERAALQMAEFRMQQGDRAGAQAVVSAGLTELRASLNGASHELEAAWVQTVSEPLRREGGTRGAQLTSPFSPVAHSKPLPAGRRTRTASQLSITRGLDAAIDLARARVEQLLFAKAARWITLVGQSRRRCEALARAVAATAADRHGMATSAYMVTGRESDRGLPALEHLQLDRPTLLLVHRLEALPSVAIDLLNRLRRHSNLHVLATGRGPANCRAEHVVVLLDTPPGAEVG